MSSTSFIFFGNRFLLIEIYIGESNLINTQRERYILCYGVQVSRIPKIILVLYWIGVLDFHNPRFIYVMQSNGQSFQSTLFYFSVKCISTLIAIISFYPKIGIWHLLKCVAITMSGYWVVMEMNDKERKRSRKMYL